MSDDPKSSHWKSLADELGTEFHEPVPRPQPEPQETAPAPAKANKTKSPPPLRPAANWGAVAETLGLPPPVEPPPAPTPAQERRPPATREEPEPTFDEPPADVAPAVPFVGMFQPDEPPPRSEFSLISEEVEEITFMERIEFSIAPSADPEDAGEREGKRRRRRRRGRRRDEGDRRPSPPSVVRRDIELGPVDLPIDEAPTESADASPTIRSTDDDDSSADEGEEDAARVEEGHESPSDGSGRRRRRRRGGRRGRRGDKESPAAKTDEPKKSSKAPSESDAFDDVEFDDAEEPVLSMDAGDEVDDGEDDDGKSKASHRNIPTWEESIRLIVDANMESRARNPNGSGQRPRRGRGGRGRGAKR